MKGFRRITILVVLLVAAIIMGANFVLYHFYQNNNGRLYRIEINRLQNDIAKKGAGKINWKDYDYITKLSELDQGADETAFLEGDGSDYVIKSIGGRLYRFDYEFTHRQEYRSNVGMVNLCLGIMAILVIAVLIYIRIKLLKPFHLIKEVPYELSKGNLSVGLREDRNRYFGRFIWGLDLLREKLEGQKEKELALQKEKKTLVLSISHDIKTPLSAISLYATALSRNIYDNEEKRKVTADCIVAKVKEIEGFISEIIKASSEDFLSIEVRDAEFYMSQVMDKVKVYYKEKLSLLRIDFTIEPYDNCLINGDPDRAVEVLQNVIENAIKYGDGSYIRITIAKEEDCRLITVVNSGNTLPDNELPHIFESFWRGSNSDGNNGNGLGLYICRQLMKRMNGSIYAKSMDGEMQITTVLRSV